MNDITQKYVNILHLTSIFYVYNFVDVQVTDESGRD